jgi:hypothetical protein
MKQLTLSFLLALLPMLASADAVEIDGIYYNLITKSKIAEVTGNPNGYSGDIVIPEKVHLKDSEYSVTSIGDYTFLGCSRLTSIKIPNSVTSIGQGAFIYCGISSIYIPNSVNFIGGDAFLSCNLSSVHIEDLESWMNIQFEYNPMHHESRTSNPLIVAHHLFINNEEIKDLIIPQTITIIPDYVFSDCSSLTSVTIPNSVTSIGSYAFQGCNGLTSVHISDLEAWLNISFDSNPLLYAHHLYLNGKEITNLEIPLSVTSIGNSAFIGCTGLTSVTIPNSVTNIGSRAFQGCNGLTSIKIPNSVSSIGSWAFWGCTSLTSATIPNSVTDIDMHAFEGCSSLTSITIPNSVKSIGTYAFYGCSDLTNITIGNGIKTINYYAFTQCPELTDVYCMAEELSPMYNALYTDASAFEGSYIEAATLHVPESAINAYKSTEPWSKFGTFVSLSGEESETQKCATPTISLVNGEVVFSCETEGVNYISEVTSSDIQKFYDDKLKLTYKYTVTVYAIKEGYENSDTTTREIIITENGKAILVGDVDGDGKVNVADHVKLSDIIMGK